MMPHGRYLLECSNKFSLIIAKSQINGDNKLERAMETVWVGGQFSFAGIATLSVSSHVEQKQTRGDLFLDDPRR